MSNDDSARSLRALCQVANQQAAGWPGGFGSPHAAAPRGKRVLAFGVLGGASLLALAFADVLILLAAFALIEGAIGGSGAGLVAALRSQRRIASSRTALSAALVESARTLMVDREMILVSIAR